MSQALHYHYLAQHLSNIFADVFAECDMKLLEQLFVMDSHYSEFYAWYGRALSKVRNGSVIFPRCQTRNKFQVAPVSATGTTTVLGALQRRRKAGPNVTASSCATSARTLETSSAAVTLISLGLNFPQRRQIRMN